MLKLIPDNSSMLVVHVSVHLSIDSFLDKTLSKYQRIFTKLGIALLLWRSGLGLLLGKFHKILTVIYLPQDSGRVLSFHILFFFFKNGV